MSPVPFSDRPPRARPFPSPLAYPPIVRKATGIEVLAHTEPLSHLATRHEVSRKFIYQQGDKAQRLLGEAFALSEGDDDVLFHLPVTKNWLYQLILGLVLIYHSSYQGVVELLRDPFDQSALALSTIGFNPLRPPLLRLTVVLQKMCGLSLSMPRCPARNLVNAPLQTV